MCGSDLPVVEDEEFTVPAGGIDGDAGVRPSVHIFVVSKSPWHKISDCLPRYKRFSPEVGR